MFKKLLVTVLCLSVVLTAAFFAVSGAESETSLPTNEVSQEKVASARFQNMLNNNTVFGEDFNSVDKIISSSFPALSSKIADGEISSEAVASFVKNMYGVDIFAVADEGKEVISPMTNIKVTACGYTKYSHEIKSVKENEDGTYTVFSEVSEEFHDSSIRFCECISTFAKNENSSFGFVLISSELLSPIDENGEA